MTCRPNFRQTTMVEVQKVEEPLRDVVARQAGRLLRDLP